LLAYASENAKVTWLRSRTPHRPLNIPQTNNKHLGLMTVCGLCQLSDYLGLRIETTQVEIKPC
jgi:hypothetical protein